MQLSESSGATALRTSVPPQVKLGWQPVDYDKCFSQINLPECKRHRISAVRDYPSSCGPVSEITSLKAKQVTSVGSPMDEIATDLLDTNESLPHDGLISAVRDYPPGCGPVSELTSFRLKQVTSVCTPIDEISINLLDRKCPAPPDGFMSVSNDNGPKKISSRKEAVWDLPRSCGVDVFLEARTLGKKKSVIGYRTSSSSTTEMTDVKHTESGGKDQSKTEKNNYRGKPLDITHHPKHLQEEGLDRSRLALDKVIVLGVMAASNCPWKKGFKHKSDGRMSERKREKLNIKCELEGSEPIGITNFDSENDGKSLKKNRPVAVKTAFQSQFVMRNVVYSIEDGEKEHYHESPVSYRTDGCPPFVSSSSNNKSDNNDAPDRNKVKETLLLFRDECGKLLLEEERQRLRGGGTCHRRVDLEAFKILKDNKVFVKSGKQIIGAVPGVDVGDKFQYRVELNIIGLHRPIQGGIDYGKFGGKLLATSIVASGGYDDDIHNKNSMIYTGQGGNVMNTKDPEDQKLERGNLALKNSVQENPVRVIRGTESLDRSRTYVYDGLYLVEKCWQERGPHGKLVFKFQMNRIEDKGLPR